MSCISSNFSSFFLDSLNDPSEFAKYLGNGENKVQTFDDFQVFGGGSGSGNIFNSQLQYNTMNGVGTSATGGVQYSNGNGIGISNNNNNVGGATNGDHEMYNSSSGGGVTSNEHINPQQQHHPQHYAGSSHPGHHSNFNNNHHHQQQQQQSQQMYTNHSHVRWNSAQQPATPSIASGDNHNLHHQQQNTATGTVTTTPAGNQHFDGSFEFLKYLRHTSEYSDDGSVGSSSGTVAPTTPGTISNPNPNSSNSHNSLIDLDSSTSMKSRSVGGIRKAGAILTAAATPTAIINSSSLDIDSFDHDSKHTIFDLQQQTTNSNSNESSCAGDTMFSGTFASNASNTSSEGVGGVGAGSDNSNQNTTASKPLASFSIKDNFDVSPAHRVEEGIFQHMNKLPPKKKETLKQLGVRFTGQMTLADKSIVVENFIKFCQEYDVTDHRPFLSLNQSGLNKPEQIKFARYLGQGLPLFTLFCIYSNFKNLFCTKRTETYVKDGYNLNYILEKTKRHLSCTTAGGTPIKPSQTTTTMQIDLKSLTQQSQSNDGVDVPTNNGGIAAVKAEMPKVLERLVIYENFDVHETHRIEDGVCTHISRLPPKKQDLLKQFGIQSNQTVTYYEKYIVIENFIKFCNEYKITDHRPFLDFHDNGLPKCEQLKFVRYLGQGLPNLTLNKIYLAFKDVLGLNRIEKITIDGYNLDVILKKKKKNLYNRMHAAVHRESTEAAKQAHRESLAS